MELCSGMSIYHHIKKLPEQRLEPDVCKWIFKQLICSIGYMHERGYAHRDLKLDNILMDPVTKKIKLIDFGFSL
jgi:serine/threonine protein kinase